jgi:mono/diheme cytochrome c family protein
MSMPSLIAQWVDEDVVMWEAIFHAHECAGCHTAAAISMAFEDMFETWKLEHSS